MPWTLALAVDDVSSTQVEAGENESIGSGLIPVALASEVGSVVNETLDTTFLSACVATKHQINQSSPPLILLVGGRADAVYWLSSAQTTADCGRPAAVVGSGVDTVDVVVCGWCGLWLWLL